MGEKELLFLRGQINLFCYSLKYPSITLNGSLEQILQRLENLSKNVANIPELTVNTSNLQ